MQKQEELIYFICNAKKFDKQQLHLVVPIYFLVLLVSLLVLSYSIVTLIYLEMLIEEQRGSAEMDSFEGLLSYRSFYSFSQTRS